MRSIGFRPWTFLEDEDVELFWFGSPYMNYRRDWSVRIAFKRASGDLNILSRPWGAIPLLRLGQIYTNGNLNQVRPMSGSAYNFTISSLDSGVIVNSFKLPKRLIDFGKNPELGMQNIIQFSIKDLTFCIPVMELLRAMFINSSLLANSLLEPHGLEQLIDKCEFERNVLHFHLGNRVSSALATESNARLMSWIYLDFKIKAMWDSVYRILFSQAVNGTPINPSITLRRGIPLSVELPPTGPIEMTVRGEKFLNTILVKEIIGLGGFTHPANEIELWHHSKKRQEPVFGEKRLRITSRSKNDDIVINDESENAKEDTNQDVFEAPPTYMKFINFPVVRTRKKSVRRTNTGNDVVVNSGKGGKSSGDAKEVSVQDSIVGGDTPPIDFQTLEMVSVSEAVGLEDFFKMISMLKEMTSYSIRMSVVRVPPGKRFSICPNGARRTCAIVQVSSTVITKYIVEVARPDEWSISTLILQPLKEMSFKAIENEIKFLLDGLVQRSGHWDKKVLEIREKLLIEKVKHYQNDSVSDWASRVQDKIHH
ncbi:Tn7-like element transposition protein TnsE [Bacillus sp. FJAT-28004]|uniref:Tn7-like element transposition protein TnsE n=1 Tax=Bacillus sp. FJAT-28004 TaxID=1679165 RepID=UPI0006B52405|nr:Tn7-like element transposition protein TnsE [Bacillus sp. FJAT-28004]